MSALHPRLRSAGFAPPLAAIIHLLKPKPRLSGRDLKLMNDSTRFTIICPCCEATLNIDADTGALLSHEEKHKALGSFEDMVKDLDKQKQTREQIFAQEMSSHKDRGRLLEEKFQEAKKKAEKDTKIYRNPLDLD
ncbi:MAG: hypothetical protein QOH70_2385 [Blastocatellia bacterium]|jgi:hypothetical protein|nr:hypothetical protein [Blastocatellia bacterium]